jgi:VIT1/CCC1 family predicted Fe2+/Mn2+ transporter
VLGADDGIVSTASLMIGVAASSASRNSILIAGLAGLVAGAGSMATGEFVSVSSQRDTERADIAKEKRELVHDPESELVELTHIYMERGLDRELARKVATQLHENNPLEAHLRDELGMTDATGARPFQAAFVSAGTFALGAAVPVLALLAAAPNARGWTIAGVALALLAFTGAVGARIGGASVWRGAGRVLLGGGIAMAVTALIGDLVGTAV